MRSAFDGTCFFGRFGAVFVRLTGSDFVLFRLLDEVERVAAARDDVGFSRFGLGADFVDFVAVFSFLINYFIGFSCL